MKTEKTISTMKDLLVQVRTMTLRREVFLKVDVVFAKEKILRFLPLEDVSPKIDIFFESPEIKRVLMEEVLLRLRLKGIDDPDEHELCNTAFEVIWSQYMRAHMNWKDPVRDMYVHICIFFLHDI